MLFLPVESKGGAIPYLDSVRHLRQKGHDAQIYLTDDLESLSQDLSNVRLLDTFNLQNLITGDKIFDSASNSLKLFIAAKRVMNAWIPSSIRTLEKAIKTGQIKTQNNVAITTTVGAMYLGHYLLARGFERIIIAEPFRMLDWQQIWTENSQFFPKPVPTEAILRFLFNRPGKSITEAVLGKRINTSFKDIQNHVEQQILMYSPQFSNNHRQVSGYPYPSNNQETIPERVQSFINKARQDGEMLLVFTLGSMDINQKKREKVIETFIRAIQLSPIPTRGIILGSTHNQESKKILHHDNFIRYGKLFPQVDAVVQHNGAGSTHSALLAGIPVFAIPFLRDQFDWSKKLSELGLLLGSQTHDKFKSESLAEALNEENLKKAKLAAVAASQREQDFYNNGVEKLSEKILNGV